MQQSYYQNFDPDISLLAFDHVIIGSGIGGLTTATWLAMGGKKVVVLEQHTVPGGFMHTFKRSPNFKWDVGVHYVGNMDQSSVLRKFFSVLTNNELEWESLGTVYDVAIIGNDRYEFHQGKEAFRQQFYQYFPDDKPAIDQYISLLDQSSKASNLFFVDKMFDAFLGGTLGYLFRKRFRRFSQRTTFEVLNQITNNKKLIGVLCSQCGNYGLSPTKSSFAAHATIVSHFMEGGFYPVGGVDKIPELILKNLEKYQAKCYTKAMVTEIVTKGSKVKGIIINERFYPCKSVISNAGAYNTFNKLLSKNKLIQSRYHFGNVSSSVGHLCLYIGLDQSDQTLNLPKYNMWCYNNYNFPYDFEQITLENTAKTFAYISFPSARDPEWGIQHPDKATIQIISPAYHEWFEAFEKLPVMKRGKAYAQIKKDFENSMLERLFQLFPQIKEHVIYTEVSTPLSTQFFSNYSKGEIYGLEHTPERFELPFLRCRTKIKGLRLVGQDVFVVGLSGAMLSGIFCACTILKFKSGKIFKKIFS